MKKQFGVLAQVILLLFLFSGCSEDVQQSSSVAEIALGADPASTILEVFGEPDRFARTEKLISLLRAVPADQTHVFEAALNGLDFPNRELDRVLVLTAWAKYDAPAATKWAKNRERVDIVRSAMYAESVYRWALEDHESFMSDMEMAIFVKPGYDPTLLRALITGWFDSGAPHLDTFIRDMDPQSQDSQRAVATLAGLRMKRDGAAATIKWAMEVGGSNRYKVSVNGRVAAQVVLVDPKLAVEWCAELCETEVGERMPHMIAASWVLKSGEEAEAMDFITHQPDATGVRTGARAAYLRFLRADPDAALAWLETTTEEERLGPVVQGPISMYVNKRSALAEPMVALEWLEYLQNDEDEYALGLHRIMRRWLRTDNNAAEAWMAQSSMSEKAKREARDDTVAIPSRR